MIQVAMLWLSNPRGELLLARRADHKAQDPGLWAPSVTGKLEPGETFEAAVLREAQEELALDPNRHTPKFLFEAKFDHPDGEMRMFKIYTSQISNELIQTLKIDRNEVAEIRWMTVDQIKQLLTSKPGETVVASAFVLWDKVFDALANNKS